MINNKYQIIYGEKLQKYPRLIHLLKSFEAGYVRKTAKVFTKDQMRRNEGSALKYVEKYIHI